MYKPNHKKHRNRIIIRLACALCGAHECSPSPSISSISPSLRQSVLGLNFCQSGPANRHTRNTHGVTHIRKMFELYHLNTIAILHFNCHAAYCRKSSHWNLSSVTYIPLLSTRCRATASHISKTKREDPREENEVKVPPEHEHRHRS